jgi:predicted enzyme related to lactoylglutathione lyase
MRATRVLANLRVPDIEAAKSFYTDYLGLSTEEFNLGWVARYTSPDTGANVQLVTRDATAAEDSVISVPTDDVEGAYEEAQRLGNEIVHPITTEPGLTEQGYALIGRDVQDAATGSLADDQAGVAEHGKMLGDRARRDPERTGQLTCRRG